MTRLTNDAIKTLSFLKKIDNKGNVVLVACPSDMKVGTSANASDLTVMGDVTVKGNMHVSGSFMTGTLNLASASQTAPSANEVSLGTFDISTCDSLRVYTTEGYTSIGANNSSWSHFYTDRPAYYFNSTDGKIIVDNVNSTNATIGSYDSPLLLRADYNDSDTASQLYLGIDGTVGINSTDPATNLGGNASAGGTYIYSTGYPQLKIEGDDHCILQMTGDDGDEVSINFNNTVVNWKVGMDNTPNTYDDLFSIKTVNGSSPEVTIRPIDQYPVLLASGTSAAYAAATVSSCALSVSQYGAGSGDDYSAGIKIMQGNHHGSRNRYVTLNCVADSTPGGAQGSAFTIQARDGSSGNCAERLRINGIGDTEFFGTITKTGGSFKIPHPDPSKAEAHTLWHSFVESPTAGDNIYRWQVDVTAGSLTFDLPDYYSFLNCDDMAWVSPIGHFGAGYAQVSEDQKKLTVTCNADGKYNVLLIGTRKDEVATSSWAGVEREIHAPITGSDDT